MRDTSLGPEVRCERALTGDRALEGEVLGFVNRRLTGEGVSLFSRTARRNPGFDGGGVGIDSARLNIGPSGFNRSAGRLTTLVLVPMGPISLSRRGEGHGEESKPFSLLFLVFPTRSTTPNFSIHPTS